MKLHLSQTDIFLPPTKYNYKFTLLIYGEWLRHRMLRQLLKADLFLVRCTRFLLLIGFISIISNYALKDDIFIVTK